MSLEYRKDIDGLRALAVLPVLLFHAGIDTFSGGYIGVDIFFVISGFLITGIIRKEITEGTFSYVDFWERRARRLIAPIVVVTIATFLVSWFFFLPEEMQSLSQSIAALSVFSSNFYFWLKSGYFAAPDDTHPLLHTWSLAVEEQFYLFFPLVLMLLATSRLRVQVAWILIIAFTSVALSAFWVRNNPDHAYYLLPSRAFELMAGALLALLQQHLPRLRPLVADSVMLISISVIAACMVVYSEETPFPGLAALLPCVATVLLMATGDTPGSRVSWLFSNKVSVEIGKLSYSLYLWHWPVIVLWKEYAQTSIAAFTTVEIAGVIAVSFLLAMLSYAVVETPIRRRKIFASRSGIFTAAGVSMGVLALVGVGGHFTNGYEQRVPAEVRSAVANRADWTERQYRCGDPAPDKVLKGELCALGTTRSPLDFVLWGDSHAQTVLEVVDSAAQASGLSGKFASYGGCIPLVTDPELVGAKCAEFNQGMFVLLATTRPKQLMLAGRWSAYPAFDGSNSALAGQFRSAFLSGLQRVQEEVPNLAVVEEVPWDSGFSVNRFGMQVWRGTGDAELGVSLEEYQARSAPFISSMTEPGHAEWIKLLPSAKYLCDQQYCPVYWDGTLYKDSNHLTGFGARRLLPMFAALFASTRLEDGSRSGEVLQD